MIEIIPAIDILGGKCVRLTKGDYNEAQVYAADPVDVAKAMADAGCRRLHLVDLDGARSRHIVNYKVLQRIASGTGLIIDFGGGVKSDEDLRIAFDNGASMVTGGSIAVHDPQLFLSWLDKYGAERIILGADARDGRVSISGWTEDSDIDVVDFIRQFHDQGIRQVISTDVAVDGTLAGPSLKLYADILSCVPDVYLVASGGVSSMADIRQLDDRGLPAVIVGKALYEGRLNLAEIERYNIAAS